MKLLGALDRCRVRGRVCHTKRQEGYRDVCDTILAMVFFDMRAYKQPKT